MSLLSRSALVATLVVSACHRDPSSSDAAPSEPAVDAGAVAVVEAAAPVPQTPEEKLEAHRKHLSELVEAKQYADVCRGAPWFNRTICTWAANRADGKGVERPDSQLYRSFFSQEHWSHAYGRLVGEVRDPPYEVAVGGYRNHCLLHTTDTKYTTTGAFNLWVQEQPEAEEVTTNSGATQHWVALDEMPLAKALMDLAHSGVSVESTARAQDAMGMIAEYKPYAERKGTLPTVPDDTGSQRGDAAPVGSATQSTTATSTARVGTASLTATAATPVTTTTATVDTFAQSVAQAQACCNELRRQSQQQGPSRGGQLTQAAIICNHIVSQAAPKTGQLQQQLPGVTLPPSCQGL
jgi:hypothetical protein